MKATTQSANTKMTNFPKEGTCVHIFKGRTFMDVTRSHTDKPKHTPTAYNKYVSEHMKSWHNKDNQ